MHIIATFFALLLSFSQASSVRKALDEPRPATTVSAVEFTPSAAAQLGDEASDYAENACPSCLKTNGTSSVR